MPSRSVGSLFEDPAPLSLRPLRVQLSALSGLN